MATVGDLLDSLHAHIDAMPPDRAGLITVLHTRYQRGLISKDEVLARLRDRLFGDLEDPEADPELGDPTG